MMLSLTTRFVALWRQVSRGVARMVDAKPSERDMDDEMHHWMDAATNEHIRAGMSPAAARRAAQLEFGNDTVVREAVRASLWETRLSSIAADVRYALRMLRRGPVFSLVIVLVVSLGTGAVTTIFSAANAFLLRPLPGATGHPQLIQIDRISKEGNDGTQASYPYYEAMRDGNRTLEGVAAWSKVDLTLDVDGQGVSAYGNIVSGNFFSVLGVRPALGRFFVPEEDRTLLTHPVVVVSHAFWRTHLRGDSAAIGRVVGVNGHPYTLIGVAPPEFRGVFTPITTSAWVPLRMQPWLRANRSLTDAGSIWLWTFARMKAGVARDAARQDLVRQTAAFAERATEPDWARGYTGIRLIGLTGLPDDARKAMGAFLAVLLGAALLVLVIASVNVAAMLSARAVARQHEMALRVALGAGRTRIVRQLLTESLVLFAFGGAGGIAISFAATSLLERIPLPVDIPVAVELSPDLRVLAFALALSLVTGIVFGLAPALRASRQDVSIRLRDDVSGGGRRRPS